MTDILTGSSPKLKAKQSPYAWLQQPVGNALGNVANQAKNIAPVTPGQTFDPTAYAAQITPQEQTLVNQAYGQAGTVSPLDQAARDLYQQQISGQYLTPQSNPFLQAQINAAVDPLKQAYQEITLPRLKESFAMAGQGTGPQASSPFDLAAQRSSRDLLQQIGTVTTNLVGQNYANERAYQQQAAAAATNLSTEDINRTIAGLNAVALPRMIEQLGIQQGTAEYQQFQQMLMQAIMGAAQLSMPSYYTQAGTPGALGGIGSLVGFGIGTATGYPGGGAAGSQIGGSIGGGIAGSAGGYDPYYHY